MPHLIIEHSSNFSDPTINNLQTGILKIIGQFKEFDPDECKCRSHSFDEYLVGFSNKANSAFIHITLKVLTGRSVEVRKDLASRIIKLAQDIKIDLKRCDISVDIAEMDRATYQKLVLLDTDIKT